MMSSLPHLPSPAMGLLMALMDSPSSAKEMILDQLSSSISSLRNGFLRRCSRWDVNVAPEEGPGQGRPATTIPTVRTSQEVVLKRRGEFQAEECPICWEMLRDSDASASLVGCLVGVFFFADTIPYIPWDSSPLYSPPSLWEDFCHFFQPPNKQIYVSYIC